MTLPQARTATSSKGQRIGAYSIGLTILGKLGCQNNKKKKPTKDFVLKFNKKIELLFFFTFLNSLL
jgi:hypothetical protein